jgi:ketosteroid isomerase-like protein
MLVNDPIAQAAHALADAIARRDGAALRDLLDPDFRLRTPGGPSVDAAAFIAGTLQIPGEIVFVKLEDVKVDRAGDVALVTGVQHAQVIVDGNRVDDRRPFVDGFVRSDRGWLLKLALDLPAYA